MRILGIDLGSTSVKAVELDSAFGRYEIHEYYEQKLEAGADPLQTVRALITSLPKPPDRVAVALRTSQATFRNIQLPTRDKKAIQASVGFELEDDLPFNLENAVYDYSVLSTVGQSTHLHVGATLARYVEASIGQWNTAGIDPDLITTEPWAFRTHLNRILSPATQEQPVMLVQIGHQRTTLYIHWRGFPVVAREINWGGRDLTTAICRKYGVPIDQAEHAKLDHGFIMPPSQRAQSTPEQQEFSDTLMQPLQELLRDIRQTELTCKSITHHNLSAIYLSGGSSLLPGLARLMEEEFHISCQPIQALSAIATSGVTYSEATDGTFLLAASVALCMVGADRAGAINLRKGAFAKSGRSREINLAALRRPLTAAATVLFSLILSLGIQSSVYRGRLAEADAQLERSVKTFFGTLSSSAVHTYMSNTSTLRTSVNKELGKQRELAKLLGPNTHSPTDFLKELSIAIPKDAVVDMTQYQVGAAPTSPYSATEDGAASLTFLITNPQIAEKVATILNGRIGGLQRSKMEEVPGVDGTSKRYKVTFSGKPTEESYGK